MRAYGLGAERGSNLSEWTIDALAPLARTLHEVFRNWKKCHSDTSWVGRSHTEDIFFSYRLFLIQYYYAPCMLCAILIMRRVLHTFPYKKFFVCVGWWMVFAPTFVVMSLTL